VANERLNNKTEVLGVFRLVAVHSRPVLSMLQIKISEI